MSHEHFVAHYDPPLADPRQARPELRWSRRGEGRLRSLAGRARRRLRGQRLAYLDSHFPWRRSGFRYADAGALLELRPDTVFFSLYEMRDPFPVPVLPLADFPRLAPSLGVTDAYAAFLSFGGGLAGMWRDRPGPPGATDGPDLSAVLRRERIRLHAALYPGGGFTMTEEGFADATRLVAAADQVLTWIPEVLARVPGVTEIDPAVIDTRFYAYAARDFAERPLRLLFAADARPRKGLDVALATTARLLDDGADVRLDVVGPHDAAALGGDTDRIAFHGWLEPERLRELHGRSHVFLSPVRAERATDADGGVTDGFPTAAAIEAMSSGCLLVTANPRDERRALRAGVDHLERPATPDAFAAAVLEVLADPAMAGTIARSGAERVRERFDVRAGARERLALMGFH